MPKTRNPAMAVVARPAKNANASKAVSSLVYHLVGKRSSEKMCIRRLRNSAGGKRRGFLPHNTKVRYKIDDWHRSTSFPLLLRPTCFVVSPLLPPLLPLPPFHPL